MRRKISRIVLFVVFLCFNCFAYSESAKVTFVKGKVEIQNGAEWVSVSVGQELNEKTVISTGFNSEVRFQYNGSIMALGPLTRIMLEKISNTEKKEIMNVQLNCGAVRTKVTHPVNKRVSQTIRSPVSVASVRGTEYLFFDNGSVLCFEGAVATFPAYYLDNIVFIDNELEDSKDSSSSDDSDYESAVATTVPQDIAEFLPTSAVVVAEGQAVSVLPNSLIESPVANFIANRDKKVNAVDTLSRIESVSMGQEALAAILPTREYLSNFEFDATGSVDVNVSFE